MITLKSKVRWPQVFELTHDCVCETLPSVKMKVARAVVGQTGRAGAYNPAIGQHEGVIYDADREFPPSITLRSREVLSNLPDAVAEAPEVVAAVKAGLVVIVKEGSSTPAKGKRVKIEKAPSAPTR